MFEIILFCLVLLAGIISVLGRKCIKAKPMYQNKEQSVFISQLPEEQQPVYYEWSNSLFPVLCLVFLLRSFIVEPFRIPSGSMLPTLEVGDFLLVNKYHYGVRLPITHTKVLDIGSPERGDVMVFRFPKDNKTNYIKRVIGLPGDIIEYRHNRLLINGEPVPASYIESYTPFSPDNSATALAKSAQTIPAKNIENANKTINILLDSRSLTLRRLDARIPDGKQIIVPEGMYFVLGDNRDNSVDSRFWGFVPEENIVGEAVFVWFHWNWQAARNSWNKFKGIDLSRVGSDI